MNDLPALTQSLKDLANILAILGNDAAILIALASLIAAALPQGTPGSVWAYCRKVIDILAANVGNAKNIPSNPKVPDA